MSQQALREIIKKAVADYGFRLAVTWGTDDVVAWSDLTSREVECLKNVLVPELKKLPSPVEPDDRSSVQERLTDMAFK